MISVSHSQAGCMANEPMRSIDLWKHWYVRLMVEYQWRKHLILACIDRNLER